MSKVKAIKNKIKSKIEAIKKINDDPNFAKIAEGIADKYIKDLPDLTQMNKEDFLFTPTKIGGQWIATENNRRDHFSKRFKSIVKDHFGLGSDYGMYSFRHTFITKLYRELRKSYSPFEAKSILMNITGHSTMSALELYLRDIDAELPEDYSHLLE